MSKRNPILVFLYWLVGIMGALGFSALFINGVLFEQTFMSFIPLILHKIVGWTMLVTAVWGTISEFFS